jgi:hypothetical protein
MDTFPGSDAVRMTSRFPAIVRVLLASSVLAVLCTWSSGCSLGAGDGEGTEAEGMGHVPVSSAVNTAGLPCDIATLIATRCMTCHSGLTGIQIASYADLLGPSHSDPSITMGEMAAMRVQDPITPMPPAPGAPLSQEEIAAFVAWVQGGMQKGSCSSLPLTCSSGRRWAQSGDDDGSGRMHPGIPCNACHASGEARRFGIAGTVYRTAHEPDDCIGGTLGATSAVVIITPATGPELTLPVGPTGNFYTYQSIAQPFHVRVRNAQDVERAMLSSPPSGNCNSCHSWTGSNGAPGRVLSP